MQIDLLETPIEYLKGIGPKRGKILRDDIGVSNYYDLLNYFPFRYVDKSKFTLINEIVSDNVYIQIKAKVKEINYIGVGRKMRMVVTVFDDSGDIDLIWFQGIKWLKDKFKIDSEWVIFGKPTLFNNKYNFAHPEMESINDYVNQPKIAFQPIYFTSEKMKNHGLGTKNLSKLTKNLLNEVYGIIGENLNNDILDRLKLYGRKESYLAIHFPKNEIEVDKAKYRLIFEELFFLQLKILNYKYQRNSFVKGYVFSKIGENFNYFYHNLLPFQLTNAQKRVVKEIRADLGSGKQMNRLLQGDVGSGKTLVALLTMLISIDNGFQACLMAPTEILAIQHFKTISNFLNGSNVTIDILTGSTPASERKSIHENLLNGKTNIIIGTHALIENKVKFKNLGLAIIDEQHRFGVEQRAKLWKKTKTPPHVLVMTATPIPRTLAMTLYGDLDISVIDELPPGRISVKTMVANESNKGQIYSFFEQQIKKGNQIYIVYPLIEESETLDLKNLLNEYEILKVRFPSPKYSIDMVHGKMKSAEKDIVMNNFKAGKSNILVATTVIEVGVDVPNANIMLIENSERFGLSQLHQLRGRVGRGSNQAYCILKTGDKLTKEARIRLKTMVNTNDGFEISNVDLKLRGPGDLEGTKQSGILNFKIANIIRDEKILKLAQTEANNIFLYKNGLHNEENIKILDHFIYLNNKQKSFSSIS